MDSIKAIIVDDEEHNRRFLKLMLKNHCPLITVIDESDNADDAYISINSHKPQLVFLDVKMPNKSGFDLLKMFDKITFEVIFVSAFNEYAITAFEYNALGYILKPIDFSKLITAVDKAVMKINLQSQDENVFLFIKTLEDKNDLINKIAIHHKNRVVLLIIADIEFIEVSEDMCLLKLIDHTTYTSSKDLKLFDGMFKVLGNFIRINKSVIINTNYIKSYSKGEICILEMSNGNQFEVSRRKKGEVLNRLN